MLDIQRDKDNLEKFIDITDLENFKTFHLSLK